MFPLIDTLKGKVLIITFNENIFKFFDVHTDFNVKYINLNPNLISRKDFYKLPYNLLLMPYLYYKYFRQYKSCRVYFFGNGWTLVPFYYIKCLSKHNTIYQYPAEQSPFDLKIDKGVKSYLIFLFIKVFLGIGVDVVKSTGIYSVQLSNKFYKKNNVIVVRKDLDTKNNTKYMKKIRLIEDNDILLTVEDLPRYERAETEDFSVFMNRIYIAIKDKKYLIKPHPNYPKIYGVLQYEHEHILPQYIPSEFIMTHPWKYVIGIESLSLIKTVELTDAKAISLIRLAPYIDSSVREEFIEWFKDKGVLMPETFEQFEEMIV